MPHSLARRALPLIAFALLAGYLAIDMFFTRDTLDDLMPVYDIRHYGRNEKALEKPYTWPVGCPKLDYRRYESLHHISLIEVNKACADPKYYIGDGKRYGFLQPRVDRAHYFRLGNDAVMIRCVKKVLRREICILSITIDDEFS